MKSKLAVLLVVAIGFAATSAYGWDSFTGAVDDDWSNAGNWDGGLPDTTTEAVIGDSNYPGVACTVKSGTAAVAGDIFVGGVWDWGVAHYSGSGSLTVEGGASLTAGFGRWGLGNGNDGTLASVQIDGSIHVQGGLDIAGFSPAAVNISANGSLTVDGSLNIGHPSYMNEGWNFDVHHSGTGTVTASGGGYYISGWAGTTATNYILYDGALINAHGANAYTGQAFWLMGGVLDVQGDATIENTGGQAGPANFGNTGWPGVAHLPVIKPSDGAVLTITGQAGFLVDASSVPTIELDVSNLTPSAVWTTIIQAGTITAGSDVGFVAGTAPGWQVRVDDGGSGLVEVMIPEPLSIALLAIGAVALVRKRR
jgi:hypothetical protein